VHRYQIASLKTCFYTVEPERTFHRRARWHSPVGDEPVLGHGFKFGPLLGQCRGRRESTAAKPATSPLGRRRDRNEQPRLRRDDTTDTGRAAALIAATAPHVGGIQARLEYFCATGAGRYPA